MKNYNIALLCSLILVVNFSTSYAESKQEIDGVISRLRAHNKTLEDLVELLKSKISEQNTLISDNENLKSEKVVLESRINSVSVDFRKVAQGKIASKVPGWEHVLCPQHGGDLQGHFNRICGGRKQSVVRINQHSGDTCGYNYYILACINL